MKRLFKKKSGFTLVEIIIAFAIFSIMASMIVQILNLMVRRKVANQRYEENLTVQEQSFIARGKNYDYDASQKEAEPLSLQFKDKNGVDIGGMNLDYQLKNWDPDNPRNGINYFVGDMKYNGSNGEVIDDGSEDPENPDDSSSLGGSSQMSRFDTRITGTSGINSVQIVVAHTEGTTKYTLTVTVDDSAVNATIQGHQQVTIFFAEGKSGGAPIGVVSVNDGARDLDSLKKIKVCGINGVNIHCTTNSEGKGKFDSDPVVFNVELEREVPLSELGFGQNADGGNKYYQFKYKDEVYLNIFGAYVKASANTGDGGEDGGEDTDG